MLGGWGNIPTVDASAADQIAAYVRRRDREEKTRSLERRAELDRAARALARCLVAEHGASRVWLFGSLAWGDPDDASDIDLAVQGLSEERYFRALGAVLARAPVRVDLVRMEEAQPSLRDRVLDAGILLEERP